MRMVNLLKSGPLLFLALACTPESSTGPGQDVEIQGDVTPLCHLGCVDEDPYPDSAGIDLGSGVTPYECFFGGHTDADQDGLSDFCENQLVQAFRPELRYWNADYVAREPYWAARPTGNWRAPIRLLYLFSYYRDEGSSTWWCTVFGWLEPSCFGHNGDSEAAAFDVYFESDVTGHWIMHAARLSRHGNIAMATRGTEVYPMYYHDGDPLHPYYPLEYPAHPGRYLRIYIAQGKHANYFTRNECNAGQHGTDTCDHVNTSTRDALSAYWNIGSRGHPLINCVESRNPQHEYYGSHRAECYWTAGARFRGWYPTSVGGLDSDPYESVLTAFGF